MPNATALSAKDSAAVCAVTGVEMAQPLLTSTKITGRRPMAAKLADS